MTGVEALQALKDGQKVKRKNWRNDEYLATGIICGKLSITPSSKYNQYRGEDLYHLEDAVLLTDEILDDFLYDDWEIVE
jgi:hypothetical protein